MTTLNPQDFKRASVNLETARIAWKELQRFFASGSAILVGAELDLVEVAFQISEDNKAQVLEWMQRGQLARVPDAQALAWYEADADVWAVVVRPYVLVQQA
ncbi:hypothetical protein MIZ01_2693 [Sideroxyarcus emersonii]|uniref:DUF2288 domain-containing protein n=1 Tax=Sideroxyarcus emersonii TaxID=2764705 RepID=A0AAN1XCB0_9PROT|nr:DUF2288 domain-containing protein [Sideroxyarcus emersonii]BCK88887.1 hypothetical protein MIZ01_2693 [Sideroxyarcus emersonii]